VTVNVEEIRGSYDRTVTALKTVALASHEFFVSCVETGQLLAAKREEYRDKSGWLEWLRREVPEISQPTASRLMAIAASYFSGNTSPALPDRLSSIRALHDALKATAEEDKDASPKTVRTAAVKTTKTDGIFFRLFRMISRPALATPEQQAFITNTAEAVRLCEERGWKLPTIDVMTKVMPMDSRSLE